MQPDSPNQLSRRSLLNRSAYGIGSIALHQLLVRNADGHSSLVHHRPAAKRVIFIFMSGGPSHLDLFDPKPKMGSLHGQPVPSELTANLADPIIRSSARVMASPRRFRAYGHSGIEYSEWVSHVGEMADEICLIRSMVSDQSNHDPAQLLLNCGSPLFGNPSFGAWVTYGLGSGNENLPGYVVLLSNSGKGVDAGSSLWGSGFMPSTYRGVTFRSSGDSVLYLNNPSTVNVATQRTRLNAISDLNKLHKQEHGDREVDSRIAAYEMAFRMQMATPELLELSSETRETHQLYGLDNSTTRQFGTNCLLARRMMERGVRFVQLFHSTWDDHNELDKNLKINCDMTDLPTAGLLRDLKRRGLLEDTLVIWAGEFGRTPMGEVRRGSAPGKEGRDHHPFAFSLWMAGGGVRSGYVHGQTDDFGYNVIRDPVHVHDLQATILHLLGLDHERLTYRHSGRDYRLTDVSGNVVESLIA
jgi:Protein of unknown function (DUF1501)